MATITQLTPPNQLFTPGGLLTVSEPFQIYTPTLIIAFGLNSATRITAEMLDMASSTTNDDADICCPSSCNVYPSMDLLVVKNAQPVCSFTMCLSNYIANLVVPGFYRLKLSDSLSLPTIKVWTQATTFDVLNNIQCQCTPCV